MATATTEMGEDDRAILREIGIDPDAPAPAGDNERRCGACSRDDHDNCSGWCFCPNGCADR